MSVMARTSNADICDSSLKTSCDSKSWNFCTIFIISSFVESELTMRKTFRYSKTCLNCALNKSETLFRSSWADSKITVTGTLPSVRQISLQQRPSTVEGLIQNVFSPFSKLSLLINLASQRFFLREARSVLSSRQNSKPSPLIKSEILPTCSSSDIESPKIFPSRDDLVLFNCSKLQRAIESGLA